MRHLFTYEYKSKFKIGNVPLIHINLGRGFRIAKGIIAIGNIAVGLFSFGALALGVFSLGRSGNWFIDISRNCYRGN